MYVISAYLFRLVHSLSVLTVLSQSFFLDGMSQDAARSLSTVTLQLDAERISFGGQHAGSKSISSANQKAVIYDTSLFWVARNGPSASPND